MCSFEVRTLLSLLALLAQRIEQQPSKLWVVGSSPTESAIYYAPVVLDDPEVPREGSREASHFSLETFYTRDVGANHVRT